MTWWAWTLLWLVLVLAAAGFLFLVGRRLLRQGLALARELSEAAETLARVSERMAEQTAGPSVPNRSETGHRSSTRATAPGGGGPGASQDVR